jgi:hypothetical protein
MKTARQINIFIVVFVDLLGLFDMECGEMYREMTRKSAEAGRKYTILEIVFD